MTEVEARETRSNVGHQTSALGSWNGEEDVDSDFIVCQGFQWLGLATRIAIDITDNGGCCGGGHRALVVRTNGYLILTLSAGEPGAGDC